MQRALPLSHPVSPCTPPSVCWNHCGILAFSLEHSRDFCTQGSLCSCSFLCPGAWSCPGAQALVPTLPGDPRTLPCGPETHYVSSPTGLLWEVRAYAPGLSACPVITRSLGDISPPAQGCLGGARAWRVAEVGSRCSAQPLRNARLSRLLCRSRRLSFHPRFRCLVTDAFQRAASQPQSQPALRAVEPRIHLALVSGPGPDAPVPPRWGQPRSARPGAQAPSLAALWCPVGSAYSYTSELPLALFGFVPSLC